MTTLYVTDSGSYLSISGKRLEVKKSGELLKSVSLEKLENLVLIGWVSISSPLMVDLMERELPVTWISGTGKTYGRLEPTTGINIERQREQFRRGDNEKFCLNLAQKFIAAKIRNSRVMLARWNRERNIEKLNSIIQDMKDCEKIASEENSIESILGYEGYSAKLYFQSLGQIVPAEFEFEKRTRQPPKDPFNSMLSLAYTLLMYECYTAIRSKGLHPYMGFLHQIKKGHPALASDIMEEWRAIICDSIIFDLVSHKQVSVNDFEPPNAQNGGIYCRGEVLKKVIQAFEKKLSVSNNYINFVDYPLTFRESIQFQVGSLVKAIEENDPDIYRPIIIR